MTDAGAQRLPATPGQEPGARAAQSDPSAPAGQALFNPFGSLGVVPPHAAPLVLPPDAADWSAVIFSLAVVAVALVRLLRVLLE